MQTRPLLKLVAQKALKTGSKTKTSPQAAAFGHKGS
jgi:hypothetical protein